MSEGRFANLEFEEDRPPRPAGRSPSARDDRGRHFVAVERDAKYHLSQARKHELAGDHEQALRSFSAALSDNPLLLQAWTGQLLMLLELAEYEEARIWANKALERFPDNPQVLSLKAAALYRAGRRREAKALSDAAIQSKGESDIVWLCRGELMLAASQPAGEDCFLHAMRLSPEKDLLWLRLGGLYLRYGRWGAALPALQEACMSVPEAAYAWYLLGRAQERLGLTGRAGTSYQQARRLSPHDRRYAEAQAAAQGGSRFRAMLRRWFGR